MAPKLTLTDDGLAVDLSECRGSTFTDAKAKVAEIPGRRFDWDTKLWMLPAEPLIGERVLLAIQPEVSQEVREWISAGRVTADAELVSPLPDDADDLTVPWAYGRATWQPSEIHGEPFGGLKPHQRALISALVGQGDVIRGLVGDEMGIGKSVEMLTIVAEREPVGPRLIVCPNSVKGVWAREIALWLGPDEPQRIISSSTPKARAAQLASAIDDDAWCIVNYEQLRVVKEKVKTRAGGERTVTRMKDPTFEKTKWAAVIADEVHRAKNRKAAQTKGLYRVRAPIMLGGTGTPIMNSPDELWSLLHWLWPQEYTSYWRFYEMYVDYTETYHGKIINGVRNADALRFELRGRLFRRTKALLDLPPKTRIYVPVTLSAKSRKLYDEVERGFWFEVEKAASEGDASAAALVEAASSGTNLYTVPNGAARLVRLRQVLSTPALLGGDDLSDKLDACEDQIVDNAHKPHVVFSQFVGTCNVFAARLRKRGLVVGVYTGETSQPARTAMEDAFQNGELDVVVGTIDAMREGITLTAADTEHWIERSWVPAWNEQGEDRCHRIGQTKPLTIYIYEAEGTIDDGTVAETNRRKDRIVSSVIQKDPVAERTHGPRTGG